MLKEFKEFALKGNMVDMAVGIIIGGAFGKIVTSIVNDIVMPIFGYYMAGIDFRHLKYELGPDAEILYGNFIQNVVDFLIIAFSIFLVIKMINKTRRKGEQLNMSAAEAPPPPPGTKPPDISSKPPVSTGTQPPAAAGIQTMAANSGAPATANSGAQTMAASTGPQSTESTGIPPSQQSQSAGSKETQLLTEIRDLLKAKLQEES
ncbi:large conductance mechanosensitive channel protein MscL [Sinanaerobacter chloroacetimidivorans]|uniref:Large-conductance mechanosensitive channel n=1 Tax=Sinanaerobacter chloroacetimidivorans TaxID=2818044 RepID=A0A8J7W2G5_9FIRM|nr:large conductance mechanosensitive channel protein MscL [Sinanaerobacter chloroacetimidivorans]MBR0599209.1 large conductance mechanosensitive channel protein MscL [Sinanaerobacter chloroacetimidivorans]